MIKFILYFVPKLALRDVPKLALRDVLKLALRDVSKLALRANIHKIRIQTLYFKIVNTYFLKQ